MKKIISLVLALVMMVACMGTLALAVEKPDEIAPSKAMWQATTADGEKSYFLELDSIVMEWAIEQAGGVTFTALKGGTLFSTDVTIPAEWDAANPIVIDLNGYTYENEKNINVSGDGNLTIKNGIVKHNAANNNRFINLGKTTGGNNDGAGHYWNPSLTLENLYVNFNIPADAKATNVPMIETKTIHLSFTIKNCTLVSNVKEFYALITSENLSETVTINFENSIFVTNADRAFRLFPASGKNPTVNMTVANTVFASQNGNINGGAKFNINGIEGVTGGNGEAVGGEAIANWTGKAPDGTDLSAMNATVIGTAPEKTTVPASVTIELPKDPEPVTPPAPVDPPVVDPVDPPAVDPVDPPVVDPVDPPAVDPVDPPAQDPVDPPAVDPDPVTPPAQDPDPVDPPADKEPDQQLTPVAPAVEEEGPNMTLIIVIAAAAVVVVAAVVIIVIKKKKA